jgi:hypothetical protein
LSLGATGGSVGVDDHVGSARGAVSATLAFRHMAVPVKLKSNAAALLQPGEQLQAVIRGQTLNPKAVPITPLRILFGPSNPYRVIIATDRRLLVCRGSRWTLTGVGDIVAEQPRRTRIGPATGLWYRTDALGERLYINHRFNDEVAAADAAS